MKISLNWLTDYVNVPMPAKELAALLLRIGINVEGIVETESDVVLDLEITSNRSDLLGHIGVARELAAATGEAFHAPAVPALPTGGKVGEFTRVDVLDPDLCPRYTARVIRGVKVGPSATPEHLVALLDCLDPGREPGRVTLISRFGATRIQAALPPLLAAVQRTDHPVLWSCDPMHGNGTESASGYKTRDFGAILAELRQAFELHRAHGSHLGGVHIELTGEAVTECTGGTEGLSEADLARAYETGCDPRLNGTQSLEMAFLIAEMMRG